jgi:hypothetical protein
VKIKIDGVQVDVLDARCPARECYRFMYDYGTFVQGRGYVSVHREQRAVCGRRHLHGCPSPIPAPLPCCSKRDLPPLNPKRPQSRRRCRSCGAWTTTSFEERKAAREAAP